MNDSKSNNNESKDQNIQNQKKQQKSEVNSNDIKAKEDAQEKPKDEPLTITNFYLKSSHPVICIVTVLLKLLSLGSFIVISLWISNEAWVILVVLILGSCDFWFTKNISGRILAGLRWWNHIKPNGEEVWIFESKHEQMKTKSDITTFWTSLYCSAFAWVIWTIWELIRIKFIWFMLCFIMAWFACTNWYGYFKCSKTQQQNALNFGKGIASTIGKQAITHAFNN